MRFYNDTMRLDRFRVSSSTSEVRNLADLFLRYVDGGGEKPLLSIPRLVPSIGWTEDTYSFEDLKDLVFQYQHALISENFKAGDRVLILAPVQAELYAVFYALCSLNAVPVFIDTSVGIRNFLKLLKSADVRSVIAVPEFHKFRWIVPQLFKYRRYTLSESGRGFTNLKDKFPDFTGKVSTAAQRFDSPVLITYTTGSTGQPKGADRAHGILYNQYVYSRLHWLEDDDEIDMPWFPMVAFQNFNCGVRTVLPATNFRRIDDFNPAVVTEQILRSRVTRMSAPPSVYEKLCNHLIERGQSLPSIRRLIVGGAPVSQKIARLIRTAFPKAEAHIVYGSTEAEPIAYVSIDEWLKEPGEAYLVGKSIPEIEVRVCKNINIESVSQVGLEPFVTGGQGEILISGNHVIRRYLENETANKTTKLMDPSGRVWHRTGDLGFFDHRQRLWIIGRESDGACYGIEHQIELLKGVRRAALGHSGRLYIQIDSSESQTQVFDRVQSTLKDLGLNFEIEFRAELPLDRRHRTKIDRRKL